MMATEISKWQDSVGNFHDTKAAADLADAKADFIQMIEASAQLCDLVVNPHAVVGLICGTPTARAKTRALLGATDLRERETGRPTEPHFAPMNGEAQC